MEVDEFEVSEVELEYSTEDTLAHPGTIDVHCKQLN